MSSINRVLWRTVVVWIDRTPDGYGKAKLRDRPLIFIEVRTMLPQTSRQKNCSVSYFRIESQCRALLPIVFFRIFLDLNRDTTRRFVLSSESVVKSVNFGSGWKRRYSLLAPSLVPVATIAIAWYTDESNSCLILHGTIEPPGFFNWQNLFNKNWKRTIELGQPRLSSGKCQPQAEIEPAWRFSSSNFSGSEGISVSGGRAEQDFLGHSQG